MSYKNKFLQANQYGINMLYHLTRVDCLKEMFSNTGHPTYLVIWNIFFFMVLIFIET